ncbi:hypothetical protein EAG_13284 [Camponotus floridanus]|uniref:Sushi domain-containing protein n=1 Tax=Camponotus floridanus TaxID=104421 RepID=E2AET6_CAMFO|nr:hypothetical protein EAG_13284 [Camponotus floridanus]
MNLRPGSYLIYSCNPGYKIKGSMDVSCNIEGKWLNIPSCIEIRCQKLSTTSINANCTYNSEWVSCNSPVLPGTSAKLSCRDSYQYESNILSSQRNFARCNENGQWVPEPIRCIPAPLTINVYLNDTNLALRYTSNVTSLIVNGVPAYNVTEFPWHATLYLDVKHIYIVCNYLGLAGNYIRDIAILELMQPFVLSSTLAPVCIDLSSDKAVLEAGATGKVWGFGNQPYRI